MVLRSCRHRNQGELAVDTASEVVGRGTPAAGVRQDVEGLRARGAGEVVRTAGGLSSAAPSVLSGSCVDSLVCLPVPKSSPRHSGYGTRPTALPNRAARIPTAR